MMRVAANKSRVLSRPKSKAPLVCVVLQNRAIAVLNRCLAVNRLATMIDGDHLMSPALQLPPPQLPQQVPSEECEVSSELYEVPSEECEVSSELYEVPSELYEVPSDEMSTAFEQQLPTQQSFIMQSPNAEAHADIGECAELAGAELAGAELDPDFERCLIATIHASTLIHASNGTAPTMDDFFALHALVTRATDGTSTPQDRETIEFLMQALR
jgi:hypothetical protein